MKVNSLKMTAPFSTLFSIDDKVLQAVKEDIQAHGYDTSQPIVVWNNTVIDGHTRLRAAMSCGLTDVPVHRHDFNSAREALVYAIHNQRDRRNLTNGELLRVVELVDEKRQAGRKPEELMPTGTNSERSADTTAKTVGISPRQVSRVRTVLDEPAEREAVERGDKSLYQADLDIHERKRYSPSVFNYTNENIKWARWSWNPVTGCKHGCEYCYARDIANRFYAEKFEPTFHANRLDAPANTKPKNEPGGDLVFVCSMADLFGEWVPDEWISKVIEQVETNPQWTFLFLTKSPKRYADFDFPDNAWLGATIDKQTRVNSTMDAFRTLRGHEVANPLYVSCEPLLEAVEFDEMILDWLIIGARSENSAGPEAQPEWKWVESLINQARDNDIPTFCKPNLQVMIRDYPTEE